MTSESMEQIIANCLSTAYGVEGKLQRLGGENLNFLVTPKEGVRRVVKVVDDSMPASVIEMHSAAIEHAIAAGLTQKFPEILKNKNKKLETRINNPINGFNRLILMKYISGNVLDNVSDISTILLLDVGKSLAEFHGAMREFQHPAAGRSHRWNLAEAGQHRPKLTLFENGEKRQLLEWAFDTWQQAAGHFSSLPAQFIHGDLNRENILVSGDRVTGLLDFGDCCVNPTVCDLAICLTYLMLDQREPAAKARIVSQSYQSVRPLNQQEKTALFPLICGRLAVSLAVCGERRGVDPDNPNWFGSEASAWRLLYLMRRLDANVFLESVFG